MPQPGSTVTIGGQEWRVVSREDYSALEGLEKKYREAGRPKKVDTAAAWQFVEDLTRFWISRWPQEFRRFKEEVKEIQETRSTPYGGANPHKESSQTLRYLSVMPMRIQRLLRVYFPEQKFDKKFMREWTRRFELFRVTEKL